MVEAIAVIVIIAVICIILRVSLDIILIGVCGITVLFVAAIMLFFLYYFCRLITSEKEKAVFSKIDKSEKNRFMIAFYTINSTEYPNVFPCEKSKKIYHTDKTVTVFLNRKLNTVFDKFSVITIILGTLFSTAAIFFIICLIIFNK